ncbi:hypothetical protein PSP31121_05316 [Pandoraea sputorum]|uniref:Uncharacterized protein n=1 Tax=Pandoraea sputorum TaxID=93222 RepID=A0A5E5BIB1_9BURK|nr:hypothetical protein PSP31121_05316 [Pandoraea sputorum]
MAGAIERLAQRALFSPIGPAWNDGLRIDPVKMCNERVAVIRLVGSNAVWPELYELRLERAGIVQLKQPRPFSKSETVRRNQAGHLLVN